MVEGECGGELGGKGRARWPRQRRIWRGRRAEMNAAAACVSFSSVSLRLTAGSLSQPALIGGALGGQQQHVAGDLRSQKRLLVKPVGKVVSPSDVQWLHALELPESTILANHVRETRLRFPLVAAAAVADADSDASGGGGGGGARRKAQPQAQALRCVRARRLGGERARAPPNPQRFPTPPPGPAPRRLQNHVLNKNSPQVHSRCWCARARVTQPERQPLQSPCRAPPSPERRSAPGTRPAARGARRRRPPA